MFLFPIPQRLESGGGHFDYTGRYVIKSGIQDVTLKRALLRFIARAERKWALRLSPAAGEARPENLLAELVPGDDMISGEYHISITSSGAEITAGDAPGFIYGLGTLVQILADGTARVPEMEISDKPDLARRGYMLDISRCKIPTMESLKEMIDVLADLRCNELQLYTEHTFAFHGHESVWADFSPMTPGEIMELDIYCRDRFIELVPNQNSFGHLERWLKNPRYTHLAESPVPWYYAPWDAEYQSTLFPSEEAVDFLRGLYSQLLPNFSSGTINIGCDETLELGHGRSKERCGKEGTHNVYLDFLSRINALAGEFGKKVQFWGDIILHSPELISKLPEGITAMEWGYEAAHPFAEDCAKFAAAGIPFYVCPGTSAWNTFIGRSANMIANISNACREGTAAGAAGMLLTDWGDDGHHQYWPISWPGLCYAMACSWNSRTPEEHARLLPAATGYFWDSRSRGATLGAALLELGDIYRNMPEIHNSTIWCSVFFRKEESRFSAELLKKISPAMIKTTLKKLDSWLKRFHSAPPTEDELVLRELTNGVRMTRCALGYLLYRKNVRIDREQWRDEMKSVIAEHEYLWLCRNRTGGLRESSENLRRVLDRIS